MIGVPFRPLGIHVSPACREVGCWKMIGFIKNAMDKYFDSPNAVTETH